jgi:hypothetical protein
MIALACNNNPTEIIGLDKLISWLQVMLDGYRKGDPPAVKKLPIKLNIPKLLVTNGYHGNKTQKSKATADLTMIAFYYLLWVHKYTVKGPRNSTKQSVQFKYKNVTFSTKNDRGELRWLPPNATDSITATANREKLKLDNNKNGWKGICVYQEANGDDTHCPIQALGRRNLHLRHHGATAKTFWLAYFNKRQHFDITLQDISVPLELAATILDYPATKGIPIDRIDTHFLRCGGANTLSRYYYTQIQKWVGGKEPHSKNTSEKNLHVSWRECISS